MSEPRLERYEVINELGQGGMSVVYRARDKQLSRDVALKVLHDFLAKQTDARRRFHREAVAVAKLHHPGIVEIFDYSGPDAEQSYIVTELIEGATLRELLEQTGRPRFPELGVLIAAELVRALRHAHEQGIVHRDLKPENIMVTKSGQLKLMDFGIAQIMGGATKLTATGTLLGSPAHMAPEVIDGKSSDHRSDIFSLGTILYWLTTGELPFEAPNPSALFRRILEGRYEPPQLVEPKIGNRLARMIDRALALEPEDRYQDISELETDLEAELSEVGLETPEVEVKALLQSPIAYADTFEPKLVERLMALGERALGEKRVARAMDCFNRVLAVDAHHERAQAMVSKVGRRERLSRGMRRAAVLALASLSIGGAAYGAVALYPKIKPEPPVEPPKTLASVVKPKPPPEKAVTATVAKKVEPEEKTPAPPPVRPKKTTPRRIRATRPRPSRLRAAPAVAAGIGASPATTEVVPTPEVKVVRANLSIKIKHWGDVRIDGKTTRVSGTKTFGLDVGDHEVEVSFPGVGKARGGKFEVRRFHVDETGGLFELRGGRKIKSPSLIMFVIPRDDEEAKKISGWSWS